MLTKTRLERLEKQIGMSAADRALLERLDADEAAFYRSLIRRQGARDFESFIRTSTSQS